MTASKIHLNDALMFSIGNDIPFAHEDCDYFYVADDDMPITLKTPVKNSGMTP